MNRSGELILQHLESVNVERAARAADGGLASRVTQVKEFQQARFAHTYADLLAHPRYAGASKFFLDDLYGPGDFSQRDAQFARVVPGLVRLFPHEVAETVEALTALHALSEQLDTEMARHVDAGPVSAAAYLAAWRLTGQPQSRQRQIDLMVEVGHALDVYTRRPLLRHSLHLMRAPRAWPACRLCRPSWNVVLTPFGRCMVPMSFWHRLLNENVRWQPSSSMRQIPPTR